MKPIQYQVLVIEQGVHSFASIPDLDCEAVGHSPDQAIAAVREDALRRLQRYDDSAFAPPKPSSLTIARIELPAPVTRQCRRRARGLSAVPDLAGTR